jgi:hypothetical protein
MEEGAPSKRNQAVKLDPAREAMALPGNGLDNTEQGVLLSSRFLQPTTETWGSYALHGSFLAVARRSSITGRPLNGQCKLCNRGVTT